MKQQKYPDTRRTPNLNFRLLVIGQIVTLFGSSLLRFVLSLYVLDITGRADIFSALYALSSIPLLLSPVAGAVADRVNRRKMMVAIDFTNGVIVLGFIILLSVGSPSVFAIGAVMVLLGITGAMESPTVMACVPSVAPEGKLEQANGVISGTGSLAQIIAPLSGGLLYGLFTLKVLVMVSMAAFFLSSFMEIFIQIPFVKREQQKHIVPTILDDLKEGFAYCVKQSLIFKCVILAAVLNLVVSPYFMVGIPIILRVAMRSTDTLYGIGVAITEAGTILGALSIGLFAQKMTMHTLHRALAVIGVLLVGVASSLLPQVLALGFYPAFILFFLFALPVLMMLTCISIYVITQVQKNTPDALLGKVMAIIMAAAQISAPIGIACYGLFFEASGGMVFIPTVALAVLTLLIASLARTMLKKIENLEKNHMKYQYRPVRFYLIVFVFTWAFWIPAAFVPEHLRMTFMLLGLLVPSITAFITILTSKSSALKNDFRQKIFGAFRIKPLVVIAAICAFFAIIAISILLSTFAGQSLKQFSFVEDFSFSIGGTPTLLVLVLAALLEELGWRGYAEDAIASYCSWWKESVIFGLVWALWHLPLFFIPDTYHYNILQQSPLYMANFFVSIMPLGFLGLRQE